MSAIETVLEMLAEVLGEENPVREDVIERVEVAYDAAKRAWRQENKGKWLVTGRDEDGTSYLSELGWENQAWCAQVFDTAEEALSKIPRDKSMFEKKAIMIGERHEPRSDRVDAAQDAKGKSSAHSRGQGTSTSFASTPEEAQQEACKPFAGVITEWHLEDNRVVGHLLIKSNIKRLTDEGYNLTTSPVERITYLSNYHVVITRNSRYLLLP